MKISIKGKGEINLSQNDFLAAGGQASVYSKGNKAYKIYTNKNDMIPVGKIQELATLTHPNIIKPEDILLDAHNAVVGYNMKLVPKSYSLCQLFPKSFKDRNNIKPQASFELVKKMQDIMKHCHDNKVIVVDFNEMNVLVDEKFKDVYLIDIDSVQTPSFHATALMDSIRDRHSSPNQFDEGTDWFAFAIVSFYTMIGIHPYKGKHPSIKDIDTRMIKNISVFNKDVSIPSVCYDFSVIPKNYINWYKALFDEGKRLSPPFAGDIIQVIQKINTVIGNNTFDIKELFDFKEPIENVSFYTGVEVCSTDTSIFVNRKKASFLNKGLTGITPKKNRAACIHKNGDTLELFDVMSGDQYMFNANGSDISSYDGRFYIKDDMNILETHYIEMDNKYLAQNKIVGRVMPNAMLFPGGAIQNLMGTYYISLFPKTETCYQLKLNDLKGAIVIGGKFENNVLMLLAVNKNGTYDKLIYRFNSDYTEFDMRFIKDVDQLDFNFIVLDNGLCVHIPEEGTMELFSNRKDSANIKVIQDSIIKTDMRLTKNGASVLFTQGSKLYSLKMK